ncbi:hypothetical protein ACJRO7_010717 [Eucalyptus globulus]|uniref:Cupin type-1 domain-containing protein n=1 Tax=Eucalyptus globulus TaxID=34317 RepID=A0ABD3LIC3_EUCGL
MAKPLLLSFAFCFLLAFHGCLGRQRYGASQQHSLREQGECRIDRLDALEPTNRIQCEAGVVESWDPNHEMFQCAGIAVVRHIIEPNGLVLPSFTNSPQLTYIVEGNGILGTVIPGCPETFQSSQQSQFGPQFGQGGQMRGGEGQRFQDQHQKISRFRQGDVIALPTGVAQWVYNDGNRPIIAVTLLDVTNNENQLDISPRRFFLAGNPQDEHEQGGQQRQGRRPQQRQRGEEGQQRGQCNNVFCGFDARFLAEAFNVDLEIARRLQNENDNRNNIVRVEGGLQVVRPPREHGGRGWEEERERERYGGGRYDVNGLEETLCTMRLRENIGDPSRADVYTQQAGHISALNSHKLPILYWLQLSAEKGHLHRNAIMVPHYNLNCHSVVYAIRGSARIQVVSDDGQTVFDEELREGQLVVVPQNFAVVKRAENEEFEWVSFKTNDNAMVNPLAGRTSVMRALPDEVIANAYQVSREDAKKLKYSRRETTVFSSNESGGSFSERRAEA